MTFAAPFFLFALLPWAAVVAFLIWGRRRRVDVPFLDLWPSQTDGAVKVRRRATPPPVALALAILAMLLAILAAARPGITRPLVTTGSLTLVIDRGWATSIAEMLPANPKRYNELARHVGPVRPMEVWAVPAADGEPFRTDLSDISGNHIKDAIRPTALDTRDALHAAVRERLGNTTETVLVVSNPRIELDDDRLVSVAPDGPVRNARIVLLSVRETPAAQTMVRLRATAPMNAVAATVRVSSGAVNVEKDVTLIGNEDVDVFVDLPRLETVVKAELVVEDDRPADNVAWVVREASWPRVEPRMPLPAHLQRMVEVYSRQRPPTRDSSQVAIVSTFNEMPAGEPAVILPGIGTNPKAAGSGKVEAADHPVTRNLTTSEIDAPHAAADAPPAGWTPVLQAGGKVWVAVREEPIRAVWVGVETADWARSAEYVVFWTNVFNWVGAGGERFASHPVGSLEGDWTPVELAPWSAPPELKLWPGLYRRSADAVLRALRPPEVTDNEPVEPAVDWRARLAARLKTDPAGRWDLAPGLALSALGCLAVSGMVWKRREPSKRPETAAA